MTTSGQQGFSQTLTQIVNSALIKAGIYSKGKEYDSFDFTQAVVELNMMIAAWNVDGPHLWQKEEAVLFLQPEQQKYVLGSAANNAYTCNASDFYMSQLTVAGVVGDSVLTMSDTGGMEIADNIGIVLDDKTIQWTTIVSVDSVIQVTINDVLTSAAAINQYVYSFTDRIYKPMRILNDACRFVTGIDTGSTSTISSVNMYSMAYKDYMMLPNKTSDGWTSSQFTYNPKLTTGDMYLWPRPISGMYRVEFSYIKRLQDMINSSNTADFPDEWLEPIVYQLATRLCINYGKFDRLNILLPLASTMLNKLQCWDQESTSIFLSPIGEYE